MLHLLWSVPALVVVLAIASGRLDTTRAALLGLVIAVPIAAFSGPADFGADGLLRALSRGLWIGATIAPYILGGLLFWQVAALDGTVAGDERTSNGAIGDERTSNGAIGDDANRHGVAERRGVFGACFLVGPFAESATGFGVGMLGTIALVRRFDIAPPHLMVLALMSQTMIPWGAMGSGTLLAAAYARVPAWELGLHAMLPIMLLYLVWLPLFWRTARLAGFGASRGEQLREVGWIVLALVLLASATIWLGPETALLAAYGPLIVLRHFLAKQPGGGDLGATARRVLPYVLLIGGLVATRVFPALRQALVNLGALAPFADLPVWSPIFHAGSWLLIGGVLTALFTGRLRKLPDETRRAWKTGKHAILGIFLFAMLAEVLTGSGISRAFAESLFATLHAAAVIAVPVFAGGFGILANSGNAPNSLFMPSLIALATQAGLSVVSVAALQHVSASSMGLFSPVRMNIAASLAHGLGQERTVYRTLLPWAAGCVTLLLARAVWIVLSHGRPG